MIQNKEHRQLGAVSNSYTIINVFNIYFCSFLQSAWMNQEIFDLVHPDDADKIKDQISATESPDAGRVLDLKSKPFIIN